MLKMGAQNITGLYVGETKIKKAYLGESLIFSAGMNPSRLPEGYTEVKYIQIGENFEIDTGIKADFTNMRFVLSEEILSESRTNRFFQCTPEGGKYFECYHSPTVQNTRLIYSFATSTGWYISLDDPNDIYIKTTFDFNFPEKYFSAFGKSSPIYQSNSATNANIFIGSVTGTGSNSNAKIFSCQLYMMGEKVRDFVPCINQENAIGLYDLVNIVTTGEKR